MAEQEGTIGEEGVYKFDFADGKIVVDMKYQGTQGEAGVYVKLDLIEMLRVAAAKTDNTIDDKAVEMIAGML